MRMCTYLFAKINIFVRNERKIRESNDEKGLTQEFDGFLCEYLCKKS